MIPKISIFLLIGFALVILGCNTQLGQNKNNGTAWGVGSFNSNGKRIYFTGTSDSGNPITYTGGPEMGMMMMGGNYACVSCHGTDANGGRHVMHMEIMDAPGIRWSTLTQMKRKELGNGENDVSIDPYTFADFKMEVIDHMELNGEELKDDMPQWKMSDQDLHDLMDYLKSLQ